MLFCIPYLIIGLCVKVRFSKFKKSGDFSYGMYIYAFPVQQTLICFIGDKLNIFSLFALTFCITLFISILSWKYVEKPALKLKRYLKKSQNDKIEQISLGN